MRVNDEAGAKGAVARTPAEATKVATSTRDKLGRRKCHPEVLGYCSVELLTKDHFHARLETTKSMFGRLRSFTGVSGGGVAPCTRARKSGVPLLAINSLQSQTERDEQTGFANLVKGLNGLYRNPTAHDPRLNHTISGEEIFEILTMVFMAPRRLDERDD